LTFDAIDDSIRLSVKRGLVLFISVPFQILTFERCRRIRKLSNEF